MAACHDTHVGVEGCIRRARESMFWPHMATDLKTYISKCDICMAHCIAQSKETLLPHDFQPRPWAKVGADLCGLGGQTLLVASDYFRNFIKVENLRSTITQAVAKRLRVMFACYGVPDILITDNGLQWAKVKTVKRLLKKFGEAGLSEYCALLDWRNTPSEGVGTSPVQWFLGRRCKPLLPITHS